jgi:hypothetical protein
VTAPAAVGGTFEKVIWDRSDFLNIEAETVYEVRMSVPTITVSIIESSIEPQVGLYHILSGGTPLLFLGGFSSTIDKDNSEIVYTWRSENGTKAFEIPTDPETGSPDTAILMPDIIRPPFLSYVIEIPPTPFGTPGTPIFKVSGLDPTEPDNQGNSSALPGDPLS